MRSAIVLLALAGAGALFPIGAAEADQGGTAPATAPQPSQDTIPAQPAASPPDLAPGAKVPTTSGSSPSLTPAEQNLVSQGYSMEVRNGQHWFCKRAPATGTGQQAVKHCQTVAGAPPPAPKN